ncbi:hypothetical protein [uncultured Flavobacterium sp.]|jgi:hypothetical protein|uniref:hypothetical protein n=1 Tax=uncultured Flavobacterium sp. TaxID=165435 RepID=UPI00262A3B4F|nr:hypothetical protein [uncultured Flavobacterium sp.]
MSIIKFPNTAAGKAQAEATLDPKYIAYGARITVFTGVDVPPAEAVLDPSSIILTSHQLHQGALAIGQTRLNELKALIASPPTPAIGLYLDKSNKIARNHARVNNARTTLGWTNTLMDQIFVSGSGLDP